MSESQLKLTFKRKRKNWNEDDMMKAITAFREKEMTLAKASKRFKVPQSTLYTLSCKKDDALDTLIVNKIKEKRLIFPPNLEEELLRYLNVMRGKFYGLTSKDVKKIAYQLAERNKIPYSFSDEKANRAWFNHFMKRKHLFIKVTDTARRYFSEHDVEFFFDILEIKYDKYKYPSDRIFTVGELGLRIVQDETTQVVGVRGRKQIASLTAAERNSLMTIIVSMSASGIFVPPMMIFPVTDWTDELMKGAPPEAIGVCHPSGWVENCLFTQWFQHFINKTKPTVDSPVLLLLDGHFSHTRNLDVILMAEENHVFIISLPPYTSHKLQPLEITFIEPLKSYYSEEIRKWMCQSDVPVSLYNIAELFGRAYLKVQSSEVAVNGFREAGIFPVNRDIFTSADYIAAPSTEADKKLIENETGDEVNCSTQAAASDPSTSQIGESQKLGEISPEDSFKEKEELDRTASSAPPTEADQKLIENEIGDEVNCSTQAAASDPSTSQIGESQKLGEIFPEDSFKEEEELDRKASSVIITSSI